MNSTQQKKKRKKIIKDSHNTECHVPEDHIMKCEFKITNIQTIEKKRVSLRYTVLSTESDVLANTLHFVTPCTCVCHA